MKAKIISEMISEGLMAAIHGEFFPIKRIVIKDPAGNNLAITSYNHDLLIWEKYIINDQCINLGEVDLPDDLAAAAFEYSKAKEKFNELLPVFEEIMKEVKK